MALTLMMAASALTFTPAQVQAQSIVKTKDIHLPDYYDTTVRAAFKRGNALFKDVLRGVGESAIDVAGVAQAESVGCVLRISEHVRRGLVDWHGACVCCRIRLLLTNVELERLEVIFLCCHIYMLLRLVTD